MIRWSLSVRADDMPRLGTYARHRAIGIIQAGTPKRDVALWFGVHRNTISSLWRRFQTTGSGSDRPRSGRPRVTSQRQDQYIRVTYSRNRFQPASVTSRTIPGLRRIHPRTVRNRLREHHIRPRRPCVRTLLLPRHPAERLRWSRAHLRCRLREREAVLFSNESRFSLDHSDGRIMVYNFDRDVRLAMGVWWCEVASQPMAGHPWSLVVAIWMHTATWRRLLDR